MAMTVVVALYALLPSASLMSAKSFNDKVLNRPYADLRRWHLGFRWDYIRKTSNSRTTASPPKTARPGIWKSLLSRPDSVSTVSLICV